MSDEQWREWRNSVQKGLNNIVILLAIILGLVFTLVLFEAGWLS